MSIFTNAPRQTNALRKPAKSEVSSSPARWRPWLRKSTPEPKPAPEPVKPLLKGTMGTVISDDGEMTTRIQFEIKHWVKGRLRVRIPRLAVDETYQERLRYEVRATNSTFRVRVNPKARSLVIEYDPDTYQASEVLEQVIVCIKSAAKPGVIIDRSEFDEQEQAKESEFKISYAKRLGLPAAGLAMAGGALLGVAVPPALLGATLIAAALPSYKRAWEALRYERRLNVDFLDSTAITALTLTGFFFPPALMVSLIESGEIIRDLTARRSARANLDLLDSLGKFARVEREGVEVEVPLEEVQLGDTVVVYPGDQIPVDGVVLSGVGLVDQCKLTGESIPITREEGHDVLAATLVVDGTMRIETRRTGANTRAGVVVALMKAAPVHDTRMEDYARKVGDKIVVPTLALGIATTLATGGNINRGVGVITFDVGTGVRVSVPTTILASLTFAARNGILMRSGRGLEQLAGVNAVVFDKTGTLTQGKAGVVGIYTEDGRISATEVLRLAATAEQGLTHPVAEAITRHARESEVELKECEEWEFRVGKGVAAKIDGRMVFVGSHRMMEGLGVDTQHMLDAHPDIVASAASQVYVADDAGLLGVILYKDPARPESPLVISKLKEMGITPYMLSGDLQNVATAIAAELGIAPEHVYAEAFPERKVEVVKKLQESGKIIAFVGDGINDSAALAHASCSVSFAGATDMARETADIVLMDDDLSSLILAIQISKNAMRVVKQNVGIVVGPNLSGMAFAALFGVSPTVAVLINNGSAIAAEMNGFRPLMGPPGWREFKAQQQAIAEAAKKARLLACHAESSEAVTPVYGTNGKNGNGHDQAVPAIVVAKHTNGVNGSSGSNGANGNGHVHIEPMPAVIEIQHSNGTNGANGSNGSNGNGYNHVKPVEAVVVIKQSNGTNGADGNGHHHGEPVEALVTVERSNGSNGTHNGANGKSGRSRKAKVVPTEPA